MFYCLKNVLILDNCNTRQSVNYVLRNICVRVTQWITLLFNTCNNIRKRGTKQHQANRKKNKDPFKVSLEHITLFCSIHFDKNPAEKNKGLKTASLEVYMISVNGQE